MTTQMHTMETDGPSRETAAGKGNGNLTALIDDALDLLKTNLDQRFAAMLDNADVYLSQLAEIQEPDNGTEDDSEDATTEHNHNHKKLLRILLSERENIEQAFFKSLNENDHSEDKTQKDEIALNNKLSLVDQDEMDEMVAVTAMYSNAMNSYEEEVNNLEARLDFVENLTKTELPRHMFDPRHICGAFQAALKQLDMAIDYKLLMFKMFDHEVSSSLGDVYKAINQTFIDADVLPEVIYRVKNQESAAHLTGGDGSASPHEPAATGSPQESAGIPEAGDHASQKDKPGSGLFGFKDEIHRFISQFMSGLTSVKGEGVPRSFSTAPAESDGQKTYTRNDLMGALSKMQTSLAEAPPDNVSEIDAEHIKRSIMADMGQSHGGAITKTMHVIDQRCIDFVGMLFRTIGEDESISMVITNLLMMLQIPIIKVAMLDENVFMQTDHPARSTLDLITKAGRGVTEDTDEVYIELKEIVDAIIQEYDVDLASFEKAVDQLQTLISREEEISAKNERVEQHAIIKQHARGVVLGEMRRITKHKVIPSSVRPLMLKYWPTLMFNYYMNHGIDSSEWLLSLKVFKHLMESLQPISSTSEWQKLKDKHASLVAVVDEELGKSHQDKAEIRAQITALQQTFQSMLTAYEDQPDEVSRQPQQAADAVSPGDAGTGQAAMNEPEQTEDDEKAAKIEEQLRIAREKIARLPADMQPGVWFEVFNGEDRPIRRLKLSVVLTDVAKLVFVDRQGVKVIEKDAGDFLEELNNGKSKLIASHSTFEHALGTVIHNMAA